MDVPMTMAILNDERTFHGVTPLSIINPDVDGYRDVLVLTFKRKHLNEVEL
jgi:hypothetical protein